MKYIAICIAVFLLSLSLFSQYDTVLVKENGAHKQKRYENLTVDHYTYPDSLLEYVPFSVIQEAYEQRGDTVHTSGVGSREASWLFVRETNEKIGLLYDGSQVRLVSREKILNTTRQWGWVMIAIMLTLAFLSRKKTPGTKLIHVLSGLGICISGFFLAPAMLGKQLLSGGITLVAISYAINNSESSIKNKKIRIIGDFAYAFLAALGGAWAMFGDPFTWKTAFMVAIFLVSVFLGTLFFGRKKKDNEEEKKEV